jgi:integrase
MLFFPSGTRDKKTAQDIANKIQSIIDHVRSQEPLTGPMLQFLSNNPKIADKLTGYEILDEKNITSLKSLQQHIEDFCDSLEQTDVSDGRVEAVRNKLERIINNCGFKSWGDIKAGAVQNYLGKLRNNGKGISHRTHNAYLQVIKQFCIWMVKNRRATESPVQHLEAFNTETDRRRQRRALAPEELQKLLQVTRDSKAVLYGMTGYERYLLYWFAAETGLRANEIRTLTIRSFDFDKLTVTIQAGYSKHRREDIQPLRKDLALTLKEFFQGKLPSVRAFGGTYRQLTKRTAQMLKADLAEAKMSYVQDGQVLDFHALRHTFITNLRFAPSRYIAQKLARHRSSAMTDRYMHIELQDERAALEKLPDITPSAKKQNLKRG